MSDNITIIESNTSSDIVVNVPSEESKTIVVQDTATPLVVILGNPAGADGPQGVPGVDGTDGTDGVDGITWYSGNSAPSDILGVNNDFYFNITTDDVYKKVLGTWGSPIVNLKGSTGAAGADGAPGPAGADGADGANGLPGANGADGKTVLNGSGAPGAGLGVDGDFYIDTTANAIYGPKTGGAWGVGISLIGPAGADGADGADGAPGPNQVTTSTSTNITGILKGTGTYVAQASAGSDYQAPLSGGTDYLRPTTDVDDVPVDGETAQPISSNWAYDHVAAADPHAGYMLESNIGTGANNYLQLNGSSQIPAVSAALLTNFPTLNQDTTGSAVYWKTSGTGKGAISGPITGSTRTYTFPDSDETILYSGGALGTPSGGTLTNCTFPTLNQNTTGTAAGLTAQYIDWSASTGGTSIANKPTIPVKASGAEITTGTDDAKFATAKALKDAGITPITYAEGTFTPAITFSGGNTGITYSIQVGSYTRIGNIVFFQLSILLTSKGTSTGSLTITGLPVTSAATSDNLSTQSIYTNSLASGVTQFLQTFIGTSSTVISLRKLVSGASTSLADTDLTNTSYFTVAGHYNV